MSHYGIYGSFRSSGGSGAPHGLTSQNHKTLPSKRSSTHTRDLSPGRTPHHQYLSPNYSSTWQPRSLSPGRYSATTTDYTRTAYSRPLLPWQHKDPTRALSPSYSPKDYVPQQPSDYSRVKGVVTSRNTVWTDLSLRFNKTGPRYSGKLVEASRRTDGSYSSTYDSGGWRARLAQQGYVASTSRHRRQPERKWHYLDDTEPEEEGEGEFVYRTSRGTRHDEQHDSVISRTRRMKLQKTAEEAQSVDASVQVDAEDIEKHREQEERRSKRTFISSRHHSWYDTGVTSYKKYLSPMPWRGSSATYAPSPRYSRTNSAEEDHKHPETTNKDFRKSVLNVDLPQTEAQLFAKRQAETRWRRTCDDLTSEDGSPSETGYDSSCTDADRSSNDTEGFFTDSLDRSCTFGPGSSYRSSPRSTPFGDFAEDGHFLDGGGDYQGSFEVPDIVDALRDPISDSGDVKNLCFKFKSLNDGSSQRDSGFSEVYNQCESPGSIHPPDLDTNEPLHCILVRDNSQQLLVDQDLDTNEPSHCRESSSLVGDNDHQLLMHQDLHTIEPSHCRKSSRLVGDNSHQLSMDQNLHTIEPSHYRKSSRLVGDNSHQLLMDQDLDTIEPSHCRKSSRLVGGCSDIDQLLMDRDFDVTSFQTFEDFDRQVDRQKSNVRTRLHCCESSFGPEKWSKPARVGLRLDIESCTKFIGTCHDIDEMLGLPTPLSPDSEGTTVRGGGQTAGCPVPDVEEMDGISTTTTSIIGGSDIADLNWVSDHDQALEHNALKGWSARPSIPNELDDCTLQLYRYNGTEGDYGNYLDLESTIDEQAEDFEDFHKNRKNAIILRTQLSVRVHAIIEKLLNSSGRELRRALFSLKQIFQDDKDLVHEFVQNDGLACLVKVGSEADQNYQNYILRALGQVMLYVDGMNGVIEHIETIQWLYSLISSKYRLVVKTALKLLLVFVEYSESNSQLLMNTVCLVDSEKGAIPWSNIMNLLKEKDSADMELLVYAVTLINKALNGLPDQDTYYDVVDNLEEQGMENVIQYYMSKQGTDLDLLQQFQIYEAVLKHEDGVPDTKPLPLDARFRQIPRSRKSLPDDNDRRKSRRHSVGTVNGTSTKFHSRSLENTPEESSFAWQDRNQNHIETKTNQLNGHVNGNGHSESNGHDLNGITPSLRRRRERDARNKSLIKEQEQNGKVFQRSDSSSDTSSLVKEDFHSLIDRHRSRFENHVNHENRKNNELTKLKEDKILNDERHNLNERPNTLQYGLNGNNKKSWMLSMMYSKSQEEDSKPDAIGKGVEILNNNYIVYSKLKDESVNLNNLKKDSSVKDMSEKFSYRNGDSGVRSPDISRIGDQSGIISRAKEGLAASKTRPDSKPTSPLSPNSSFIQEIKKPDSDIQWEQLIKSVKRPLIINDLDFTDLRTEEDINLLECLEPEVGSEVNGGPPPPPLPPGLGPPPPPPPLPLGGGPVPPPPPVVKGLSRVNGTDPPPVPPTWLKRNQHHGQESSREASSRGGQKTKKTVKLFWREVKEDKSLLKRIGRKKTIWDELKPVPVDTQKLEHLFENRAKDLTNKEKSHEAVKKSEIIVLDTKRSNAINIGMTKLPPPRTIKTAILKMDSTIMNREGIEKILTMLPTEDEKSRIAEAQMTNPDVPLGTAEQFLLTLSSISELEARLRLWAFRLDYESLEREVAEPLMDLKQAIQEIESSDTFRVVLSTLRSVGNFLNGVEIKGFHIEYLSKVPEVKDTVQKHSLLHHLCHIVMEKFPKSSDLYSEIGSVTRASKIDYGEVTKSLNKMESECKASWDYLKAILKHDCNITLKVRTTEFLTDCAERIIVLKVIHRRMINRYHKFLVYLGCTSQSIEELPIQKCCRILSEFALEYRTTRERVLQQIEKKANHRERNKTRGKMITDMERFKTKEQQADHELRQLLGNGEEHKTQKWGTVPGIKGRVRPQLGPGGSLGRHSAPAKDETLTDADDEILETLVKTATTQPSRNEPRIRKKARYGDRKSLRRTLKGGLSEEEQNILNTLTT